MGYKKPRLYIIPLASGNTSPTDSFTYYLTNSGSSWGSNYTAYPIKPVIAGRIIGLFVYFFGVAGTAENVELDVNVAGSNTVLTTTADWSTLPASYQYDNLNIPIATTDNLSIRIVCPAWVGNPTSINCKGYFVVECA